MTTKEYKPVNSDFYDTLEAYSTQKKECRISYHDSTGKIQTIHGHIADLYTENHQEFLKTRDGSVIRLDLITDVVDHE